MEGLVLIIFIGLVIWCLVIGGLSGAQVSKVGGPQPATLTFNVPIERAFAVVRDYMATATFNYGDRWHVQTADTQAYHIVADLPYSEKTQVNVWDSGKGQLKPTFENLRRYLQVSVRFTSVGSGTQLDCTWTFRGEGIEGGQMTATGAEIINQFYNFLNNNLK